MGDDLIIAHSGRTLLRSVYDFYVFNTLIGVLKCVIIFRRLTKKIKETKLKIKNEDTLKYF